MRSEIAWFSEKAERTWRVQPGRSFLLQVPYACADNEICRSVRSWTGDHFRIPQALDGCEQAIVRITSDSTSSSQHFVRKIRRGLTQCKENNGPTEDEEEYPSDELESAVVWAHQNQMYPILLIERFHAFASIADEHLLSVLSKLRELEHAEAVTTVVISPLGYGAIRRELQKKGQYPFVNSSYGDNHEFAVINPLSRKEFVAEAVAKGVAARDAHRFFQFVGGPDDVAKAVLDVLRDEGASDQLINKAVNKLSERVDQFLTYALGDLDTQASDVLGHLALSCSTPVEVQYLKALPYFQFLGREVDGGRIACASPILTGAILRKLGGRFGEYNACVRALVSRDYRGAVEAITSLDPENCHLATFRSLLRLLAAMHGKTHDHLMGIDWRVVKSESTLLFRNDILWPSHKNWASKMREWSNNVTSQFGDSNKPVLGDLFTRPIDRDMLEPVLYCLVLFLRQAANLDSPGDVVRTLNSFPETIFQLLAAGFCGFTFKSPPQKMEGAPYDDYLEAYQYPKTGRPLTLNDLFVLVPIHLRNKYGEDKQLDLFFSDQRMKSTRDRLLPQIRNLESHTYVAFDDSDSKFLMELCNGLLTQALRLGGFNTIAELLSEFEEPSPDELIQFLSGARPPKNAD